MNQCNWLISNLSEIKNNVEGFYKLVNYTYLNSAQCIIRIWCKTYQKCGEDELDYDEEDDDRELKITFEPDGRIKSIKEI